MLVIPSKIFLLLAISLIALAVFPDRIRNKAAYRRSVIACVAVFAIHAVGIGLLAIIGMPFLDLVDIRKPEDLAQLAWIGLLVALSWGAVAMAYWSAFRATLDLEPLRSAKKRSASKRSYQRHSTVVYRAEDGEVTESAS
ncbi:MAG: hypothetical protein JKY61_07655 [Planctomycetes bacterium]|nr:hypothetical protein [Planctomycetota bacterium]